MLSTLSRTTFNIVGPSILITPSIRDFVEENIVTIEHGVMKEQLTDVTPYFIIYLFD